MNKTISKQVIVAVAVLVAWTLSGFAGSRPPALDLSAIRALQVNIVDSSNCGGSSGETQVATKSAPLRGGVPGCKYRLRITVEGRVETQDAPYDYVYLNGEMLFGGDDNNGKCAMTTKTETREVELASGDNVTLTYDTVDPFFHVGAYAKVTKVVEVKSCGSGSCTISGGSVGLGSVDVALSMGAASYDSSAGEIWISEARPSLDLATPKVLQYECDLDDVEVITNAFLRQIKTPQGLADIVTNSAFSYEIRFYSASSIGAKTNGIFQLSGQPFSVWRFQNPDASTNTYNRFSVSEIKGGTTNVYLFTWDEPSSTWELTEGSGVEERTSAQEETTEVVGGYTNKVYVREVRNASDVVTFKEKETVTCYPWGEEVTQNVADPDGAALTNRWLFYTTNDVPTNSASYGRLKAITTAAGYWETYQYDPDGYRSKTKAQYLNAAFDATDSVCRVTTVTNRHVVGSGYDEVTTMEKLMGQEVSRKYKILYWNGDTDDITMTLPGFDWSSTNKFVTRTVLDTNDEPQSVTRPDGTMALYAYSTISTSKTTTVSDGAPNAGGTAITNGTLTVTTVDPAGNLISKCRYAIPQTNTLLYSAVATERDELGRPTRIEYNDGTYELKQYACCGLESARDREGIYTTYNYNEQKLVSSESRAGVTLLYTYDAKGHKTKTERQAGGGGAVTLSTASYDLAGRQTNSTDALGYATAYSEAKDISGSTVKTTRNPDNSTRCETYYSDGNPLSVTGTAVHPLLYSYGVESNSILVTEIKLGDGGATDEWVRTWYDFAGRKSRVQYADGTEERFLYNAKGQVQKQTDRDGEARLFLYNANGETEYEVVDLNTNGVVDYSGLDRITRTVREVASAHGADVQRVTTYVWPSNNVDSSRVALIQETAASGLESWLTAYGLTTHQTTVLDGSGGKTVTSTAPDGSFTVSTYSTGRLVSVTRYTASSQQVSAVTYGYDVYGRQVTATDARNGTTSNTYDNADRVTSVTTPPPTNGAMAQNTSYSYDNMGSVTAITLPDGGVVTNQYFETSELKQTSGARTYPIAYTYDSQGRVKTLTTWKNFAGGSGQAVMTWNYDPQSGYMTAKVYADNSTNGYTYTGTGRVKTRTWARGIATTYGYNSAGDLLTVVYSDGTTGVTNTYDRLGRVSSVSDTSGTRSLTYTEDGQPLSESYSSGVLAGCAVNRQYDAYSRLYTLSAIAATTSTVQYGYDGASRMQCVQNGGNTITYSYYPNSSLVSNMVFNNGSSNVLTTTKEYDNLNRLSLIRHVPGADATVSFAYSYNSANQRTRCEMADGSYWLYVYDSLGQLISAVKYWSNGVEVAGQSFKYAYDDIGNRTATTNNGRAASYTANSLNQYTQRAVPAYADIIGCAHSQAVVTVNNQPVTRQEGGYFHKALAVSNAASAAYQAVSVVGVRPNAGSNGNDIVTTETGAVFIAQTPEAFTYDVDGNLLTDSRWTNTWDGEGRLVRMETLAGLSSNVPRQRIEFVYDSAGRRIKKASYGGYVGGSYMSTNVTLCLWDGWLPLVERTNGSTNRFIWGLDLSGRLQGAGGIGGLLAVGYNGETYFTAYDGNGNVVDLVSLSGAEAATYEYTPWGELVRVTGFVAKGNPLRFSSKWQDDETGWLNFGYRVYDPHLGTFHRRDPLGELSEANVYRFVRNDSINGVDPLGLECTRSTDFHHVGLGSLAHKVIGPDNEFPWYRVVFFNYIRFPVNCLKCKKGKSPTVKVTATVTSSGVDKYDVKNDFQVITFDGGTCDKNGSAKVSVDTTMLLKLGKFINTWNAMVTLQRQVELCYDCVSCK